MRERLEEELAMLRNRYPELEYIEEGHWIKIPDYTTGKAWSRDLTDLAFQVRTGYPGTPPYGFYVPVGITYDGRTPNNYQEPAPNQPPFEGEWGIFSWSISPENPWKPTADLHEGSNLLNWVIGFSQRFREGV